MSAPPGGKRWCRTSDSGHLWASLPEDLVRLVAWRVLAGGDLSDYVRFRSVCAGWRSAAVSPRGRGITDPRFHPRRWMMLPEGHCLYPGHPDLHGYARFLNLDTGALVRVRIPLLEDHLAIDSVDGLLLLLGDQYQQGTVRLLHPFTGDITELPPLATLLPQLLDTSLYSRPVLYRIKCLASRVCASASFRAGVVSVMLALDEVSRVAFATSLDRQWNMSSWKYRSSAARLGFQGKLYMLDKFKACRFLQIDPPLQDVAGSVAGGTLQPPKLIATLPKSKFIIASCLVECDSEILVIAFKKAKSMSRVLVCKLVDLVLQKRFIPIKKGIGNNTLFKGERCMSVSSKILSTVNKGDNVVLERRVQPYLAQYHMSSGKWSPTIDDCSLYGRAPGPSHLIHYIVSCCTRSLWNKGIVLRKTPPGSYPWLTGGQVSS